MAANSPTTEGPEPPPSSLETPPPKSLNQPSNSDSPFSNSRATDPSPPTSDANVIHIPSHSRWFSWNYIHPCEVRFLPEFFDSSTPFPSKNPRVYEYYRNSIVKHSRDNPSRKITFTEVRKTLVGDVGSIRRVFDFLEAWGLINYQPSSASSKPVKWEDRDTKSAELGTNAANSNRENSKRVCGGCKSVCTIACFASDKHDLILCARCYVRANYQVGMSSSDFRRVEINEETKMDWTEKETLYLLEAVMHYGEDWKRVAQHVGGRSEKECVAHFIKLPFGEEFLQHKYSGVADNKCSQLENLAEAESGLDDNGTSSLNKRMRLTPLADTSNPIMAQAAFLSALAGVEVAQASAWAAVTGLSEVISMSRASHQSLERITAQQEADIMSAGGRNPDESEGAFLDATSQLEREEADLEKAVSDIIEVQMKDIQDKLVRFEEVDLQMEKEWQQVEQMKNMLFVDQLTLLYHRRNAAKSGDSTKDQSAKNVI